jgi:hypothetical protein
MSVPWKFVGLYEEQEPKTNKGSVTVSCRIDRELYDLLYKDSKAKSISLNSLINGLIKRYVSWERYAQEVGFIPLARETVKLIFESMEEKKLKEIAARVGISIPRELILLMFNRIDFMSIVCFLEISLSRYGMVQHSMHDGTHEFVLHHDVNMKFSRFLIEVGKSMAEDLSFEFEVLSVTPTILSARIREKLDS